MIKSLYEKFKSWSATGSIYIISDTHFDDSDCKLMDPDWISPEEHISILKKIHKNDTLICLGDVGNPNYFSELKCYKVLITGNHDGSPTSYKRIIKEKIYNADEFSLKELRNKLLEENPFCTVDLYESFEFNAPFHRWTAVIDNHLFDEVYDGPLFIADRILLSHEPIYGLEAICLNIHGHKHDGALVGYCNTGAGQYRISHLNLASNVAQYQPLNLGETIKKGYLSKIPNYHRITIDKAETRKKCKKNNGFLKTECEDYEYNHICENKEE